MSERPAIPLSNIFEAEKPARVRQSIAAVSPYDPSAWDAPVFARFRPHKNAYVPWPKGSGFAYNREQDISAGGIITADRRLLLPGAIYAVWQQSRRDPKLRVFERAVWTGWRFAPEGRDAERESSEYLAAYGLPKALQSEILVAQTKKMSGPDLNLHPVPLRWTGPDLHRSPEGKTVIAKVYPFDPKEWNLPWIAVPAKGRRGYAFEIEWDEGGMGRVGSFSGSPSEGGFLYMGALAAGQVYCLGQNNIKRPDKSVRLHIKWDGDQFLHTDRSGGVR